jgi:hypothetical protein
MDEIDCRSSILPAKQGDAAAFSAQIDGNSCRFWHGCGINSVRIQHNDGSARPAPAGNKRLAAQRLVPERILKENIALAERGAKTAGNDCEASGLARSSQAVRLMEIPARGCRI